MERIEMSQEERDKLEWLKRAHAADLRTTPAAKMEEWPTISELSSQPAEVTWRWRNRASTGGRHVFAMR
jgi:hypothetical protein